MEYIRVTKENIEKEHNQEAYYQCGRWSLKWREPGYWK